MRNLFRFLKPYAGAVVGILVVLFVQAFCDLSLPSYTSDIVNVGIQQGGIDTSIPEQISVKDMENLLLFVDEDGQNTVLENYKKDSETYKEDAYVLKEDAEKNEKTMDELSGVLGKPMLLVESLSSDSEQSRQIKEGLLQAMPRGAVSGDADIFEIL